MKPKILFILHLPPPVHGAAMVGKFIQESALINNTFNGDYINLSTSTKIDEVGKGGISKISMTLTVMAKVLKALLTKRYDLCYITLTAKGFGFYKDFIVVAILKLFRKNIIYHFHNKGVLTQQQKMTNNLLYKFTFKATKSILLSSLLYPDISKYVRKENVFFCANGIPDLNNSAIKKTGNDVDTCKLLFLSNMVVEKGVQVLLNACKILREHGILFECHFVGAWADVSEDVFNSYVLKNNLSNYIFAHGKKYDQDKLDFYHAADIFVFPTFYRNECFPLVLLEAMQFSLPLISTDEGGIAEIISDGETGYIIPKNDAQELSVKLARLIENKELRLQMGLAGRKRFEEKFTLGQFESRLSEILNKAVRN